MTLRGLNQNLVQTIFFLGPPPRRQRVHHFKADRARTGLLRLVRVDLLLVLFLFYVGVCLMCLCLSESKEAKGCGTEPAAHRNISGAPTLFKEQSWVNAAVVQPKALCTSSSSPHIFDPCSLGCNTLYIALHVF